MLCTHVHDHSDITCSKSRDAIAEKRKEIPRYLQKETGKEKKRKNNNNVTKNILGPFIPHQISQHGLFVVELLHDQMQEEVDVNPHLPFEEIHELCVVELRL